VLLLLLPVLGIVNINLEHAEERQKVGEDWLHRIQTYAKKKLMYMAI